MNRCGAIAAVLLLAAQAGCGGSHVEESADVRALRAAGRLSDLPERAIWSWESLERGVSRIPPVVLRLYPQRSVEPALDGAIAIQAELRALIDEDLLSVRVDWPDDREDVTSKTQTDRFADALAVQFATDDVGELPYIGMGEPGRPVAIWFWRAGEGAESLTASGFGSLAPMPGASAPVVETKRTETGWSVTFTGPLPAAVAPLPISIAVWDGREEGRDGRKRLSAWHLLQYQSAGRNDERLKRFAIEGQTLGDPENGKILVRKHGCIACHRLPGELEPASLRALGPDLTFAGGLHWPGYLRRSIVSPSSFTVPARAFGADMVDVDGRSRMPELKLPEEEVTDITAYLSSLR